MSTPFTNLQAAATPARMTNSFNLLMTPATSAMLTDLAKESHRPKAAVLRQLIRDHYAMTFQRKPLCVDGGLCRCPHAHIFAPTQPPGDPDRDSVSQH